MRQITEIAPGLVNATDPAPGIATAGQPTAEDLESLAEEGYAAVMDLRAQHEDRGLAEPEMVREAGMEYVSLPLRAEPTDFGESTFDRFRELMRSLVDQPVLIHCRTAVRVEPLLLAYLVMDKGYEPRQAEETLKNQVQRRDDLHETSLDYLRKRNAI